jgi:hypothetical protein
MMWGLNDYKRVFYVVGLIGIILCFAPSLAKIAISPPTEEFSEIYALGQYHTLEDYPFNVSVAGGNYSVYLGVGNYMGSSMYYEVEVKFRNASDPLPNGTVPSPLPVLYRYRVFLEDGQNWTENLTFSFSNVAFYGRALALFCRVGNLTVNGAEFAIDKTAAWDSVNSGFYFQLIAELWRYNMTSGLLYDGRFVGLWLNMTSDV